MYQNLMQTSKSLLHRSFQRYDIIKTRVFLRCLGTRFVFLELKIGSLDSEKIESLESEKSGPCRFIPGT